MSPPEAPPPPPPSSPPSRPPPGPDDDDGPRLAGVPPAPLDPRVSPEVFRRELFAATPRVWATPTLVGINAAVFVAMVLSGVSPSRPSTLNLVHWGADFGPLTTGGEWWRMLTNT